MSLMSLADQGVRETTRRPPGNGGLEGVGLEAPEPPPATQSALQRLVDFIPTETIALFWLAVPAAAALFEYQTKEKHTAATTLDWWVFAGLLVFTPVLLLLSYLSGVAAKASARPPLRDWPWWKAMAATTAFAVWAFAVPGNPFIQEAPLLMAVWVAATVVSIVLALLDPIVVQWARRSPAS
jgi:hypothetical protein